MKIVYACKDFDHIEFVQAQELSTFPEVEEICIVSCTKKYQLELSEFSKVEIIPNLNKRRFHKESCAEFEKILDIYKPDLVFTVHGSSLITNIISVLKKPRFRHIAKVSYRGVIGNLHFLFNPETLFTHNSQRVDACLGTSKAVVAYLKKQPLIKNKYIDVLYPSMSRNYLKSIAKADSDLAPRSEMVKLKLCFLGSMVRKIKGFDILAESITSLSLEQQRQIQLWCIGDKPKNVADLEKCESLTFLGFDKNPWRHFKKFDYLVMPSRLEGLGRAGAEAMNLGLPVITSGVGGIKEYITNDVNGYIVESNKASDYSKIWEKLLEDSDFKETQSRHAQAATDKGPFFDPSGITLKLLEAFREALNIRARKVK